MLTGYFKSNKPIAGLSVVLLPAALMPLWTLSQPLGWAGHLGLALSSGLLAGLVNLFLIYRSGYMKTTFLLGWTWWVVLLGLSQSGHGLSWADLLGALLTMLSVGFVLTLHQPVGNKDLVALNIGLLGALASWIRPDALVVMPLAWLGLGIYGHLNLRRVLVSLLPLAGTWALLYPMSLWQGSFIHPPTPVLLFSGELWPSNIPAGWYWGALSLVPILLQSIAALTKAKRMKRHAIQFCLGALLLLLIWAIALPMARAWIPGALSIPLAMLTANALDYTQKGWARGLWILGYLAAALHAAWTPDLGLNALLEGTIF
jgi:hypothetical protein